MVKDDVSEGGTKRNAEGWTGSCSQVAEPGLMKENSLLLEFILCATGLWGGLLYNIIVKRLPNTEIGISKEALTILKVKGGLATFA